IFQSLHGQSEAVIDREGQGRAGQGGIGARIRPCRSYPQLLIQQDAVGEGPLISLAEDRAEQLLIRVRNRDLCKSLVDVVSAGLEVELVGGALENHVPGPSSIRLLEVKTLRNVVVQHNAPEQEQLRGNVP